MKLAKVAGLGQKWVGTEVLGRLAVADNFKAHDARHGPKLGASRASGVSGLARRFGEVGQADRVEAARARVRAEIEARRSPAAKVVTVVERGRAERGTGGDLGGVKAVSSGKRAAHRPVVVGKPWEAEGLSRTEWYRRRKKEAGDGGA